MSLLRNPSFLQKPLRSLRKFRPNQSTLPAAILATAFCGISLLLIWTAPLSADREITRYGEALSETLAHSSAGLLLHQERIELAVVANQISQYQEVAGVIFYSASNEIIVLSGNTDTGLHFIAPATLDDTITGYVSVVLNKTAFAVPTRFGAWLLSLLVLGLSPFLSLGILQLSATGNRSLPIVSVPEAAPPEEQSSFALTLNLYNQLALDKDSRQTAITDALNMAHEACAIHPGIAVEIPERGALILFDQKTVTGGQAICASFLLQRLLAEFETPGKFRCYLTEVTCQGSPGELVQLELSDIEADTDIDMLITLAALARPDTVLLSESVYSKLNNEEKVWSRLYSHPLIDDVSASDHTYLVSSLPEEQARLVDSQANLILGFNQASA